MQCFCTNFVQFIVDIAKSTMENNEESVKNLKTERELDLWCLKMRHQSAKTKHPNQQCLSLDFEKAVLYE